MAKRAPKEIRWRIARGEWASMRLMCRCEGHVMVRYKGASPFVMMEKEWESYPTAPPDEDKDNG